MPVRKGNKKAGEYTGDLAQPITPPRQKGILEGANPSDKKRLAPGEAERVFEEMARKAIMLLDIFGIDPLDERRWLKLSMELAVKYVPGFSIEVQPPLGRPALGVGNDVRFYLEVRKVQEEEATAGRPATVVAACRILAKREGEAQGKKPNKKRLEMRTKSMQNRFTAVKKMIESQSPPDTSDAAIPKIVPEFSGHDI